jgi:hypothetical protein
MPKDMGGRETDSSGRVGEPGAEFTENCDAVFGADMRNRAAVLRAVRVAVWVASLDGRLRGMTIEFGGGSFGELIQKTLKRGMRLNQRLKCLVNEIMGMSLDGLEMLRGNRPVGVMMGGTIRCGIGWVWNPKAGADCA